MRAARTVILLIVGVLTGPWLSAEAPPVQAGLTQDQLFRTTEVRTAHLAFTAEAWKEIQPVQGQPTGRSRMTGGEWLQGLPGMRNGWAAVRGIEFNYAKATLEFADRTFKDVAVRMKGNGTFNPNSLNVLKVSLKIDLNKHVKGQKLAGVSTLNFHNNISDPGWVNEVLAHRLFRDAGVPAPRTSYVRVYLTVDGLHDRRYSGLYALVENVDTNFLEGRYGTREGVLLKPTTVTPFDDLGDTWSDYVQAYDPKTDLTPADEQRLIAFCKLVTSGSDADFAARVGDVVDIPAFARFMAVTGWLNNWDSILKNGQNYYVFVHPATHKMHFVPWDHDHSFGVFPQQPAGSHSTGRIDPPWPDPVRFLDRLYALPSFRDAYFARLRELSDTILTPERFRAQLQEVSTAIRPIVLVEPPKVQPDRSTQALQIQQFDRVMNGEIRLMPFVLERAKFVQSELTRLGR
jgi:spore coat protein H